MKVHTYKVAKGKLSGVLMLLMVYGCLSPVDIDTQYDSVHVVITGQISSIPDRNIVNVGRTATSERLPEPVPGAVVTLFDGQGNAFYYYEIRTGTYALLDYAGQPGETYYLEVRTPDGSVYRSSPETLPESSGEMQSDYQVVKEDVVDNEGTVTSFYYVKTFVDATFESPLSPSYVKWNVEEVYLIIPTNFPDPFGHVPPDCFITQNADPQRITLLNRKDLGGNEINDLLVASRRIDQSFHYKHYFTVYQSALTSQAYEYWRKVNIVANQNGSIFDTPPAEVLGNVFNPDSDGEKVFGYFQAVNQTYSRFYLLQQDTGVFLPEYCDYDFNRPYNSYPSECLDCLIVRNSSLTRPDWF
jgi:hypothetical protein